MPTQINGLPAHVLLIHVLVVLAPLGALVTVLSAVWPALRKRIGIGGPVVCALVLIFTPITTNAGEWLARRLQQHGRIGAISRHARLGDTFLWYAIALFAVSVGVWWWGRRLDAAAAARTLTSGGGAAHGPAGRADEHGAATATLTRPDVRVAPTRAESRVLAFAVGFVAVVVSVLVVWEVYRVGDSGAHAVWDYVHQLD